MSLNRLIRYFNYLVGFALLMALGLVYWYVWRVLPKTSGETPAPLRAGVASITRDSLGVPHIQAGSLEDALFLQGYVHAQDRLFQMELMRRYGGGELAELFGKAALESDREQRKLRLRRIAEEHARKLQPELRAQFAAYTRGVNHFMETHRGALPVEFTLKQFDPRPWSVTDTVLAGVLMFRELSQTWRKEIEKQRILRTPGADLSKLAYLFPSRTGTEVSPGSNAWVVSGQWTASGKPMVANDTHMEFGMPSRWYMAHLKAPGLDVAGFTFPGMPCVIIGHNGSIAWGLTNHHFDVQDLYRERIDLTSGVYLYQGKAEKGRVDREAIPVQGERPFEFVQPVTRHGGIFSVEGNEALALRWTGAEFYDFPFLQLNQARNWEQFRAALKRFPGPGQNFVYGDSAGNIGYQVAGVFPIRRNYEGDVPVDGASGEFEWDGFIPFEELPTAYNPASGMLITANDNPYPAGYKYRASGNWSPPYRANQIRSLLSGRKGWKAAEMVKVQADIFSPVSHFLVTQVMKAYDARGSKNPSLADAAEILRGWNGQMAADDAAPFLAVMIFQQVRRAVADRAIPGKGSLYEDQMAGAVIEKLLVERPKDWFADYDLLLLRCFVDAVEEGRRIQGRNPKKWRYGDYNALRMSPPLIGQVPYVGKWFQMGPLGLSGSSSTVRQTSPRLGPSQRMVVDLGDLEGSLMNVTLGQSGQILSSHYKDQWKAYLDATSFAMPFRKVDGDVLRVTPPR